MYFQDKKYYIIIGLLFLIITFTFFQYFYTNSNYNIGSGSSIEGFGGKNDTKLRDLVIKYQGTSNRIRSFESLLPSLTDIQTALQSTKTNQNNQNTIQAQINAKKTECIYNAIIKYLHDSSLNIDDAILAHNNLSKSKDDLYIYMDDEITKLTNINTTNMANLADSQNKLTNLKSELDRTPKPDPKPMNEMKARVDEELKIITSMKNPQGKSNQYRDGLYFRIVDGYFADNTSYFLNARQRNTVLSITDTNKSGYAYDFTHLGTATVTASGRNIPGSDPRTGLESNYILFSAEWVGYFYTKSDKPQGTVETWKFRISSDDAAYLWIGENAKGNGNNIANYNTRNAFVDNGGLHPPLTVRDYGNEINLQANTFYPIRIQFGQNYGVHTLEVSFYKAGMNPVYNGLEYYYSNGNNPMDNSDPNPNYQKTGLYFTLYSGYYGDTGCWEGAGQTGAHCYNDNTNYFRNNSNTYSLGTTTTTLNDGSPTGYTTSLTDIASATTSQVGGRTYNIFNDDGSDRWQLFSVEWVGYFYSQSNSNTMDLQPWNFSLSGDDAVYFWIGNSAKGTGAGPVAYTTGNAAINIGGLHPTVGRSVTANLMPNNYYPIRIQFGNNYGRYNIKFTFTPPGGSPTTNGNGYFYSNPYNPLDNTGGFDKEKYDTTITNYATDQASLLALTAAYNKANTQYMNLQTQVEGEQKRYDGLLVLANKSQTDLVNGTSLVAQVKRVVDVDYEAVQPIFSQLKVANTYQYTDIYGTLYTGLQAYVIEAKETCAKVIEVRQSSNGYCDKNMTDANGNVLNTFYDKGYCYYTRHDAKLLNIVNPGSKDNIAQLSKEGDNMGTCSYTVSGTNHLVSIDTKPEVPTGGKYKNGNNGTVSCDTYCRGGWDGGSYGKCRYAINNEPQNNNDYSCYDVPSSILGGQLTNVSCICEKP